MNANLEKSLDHIRTAAENGAELVLFPEVHLTEFFPQYPAQKADEYEIALDSDIVRAFCAVCRENRVIAVPNIYLRDNGRPYDASILIGKDGSVMGVQKMVHVAQADKFYEQDYYTPSDDGFHVFDTEYGRIGIVVCFDRHYPESIRTEALNGADLILIPTVNTKAEPSEMFEWEIRVQAFQNSVAIAMCNRAGSEGGMEFSGESVVVGANGEMIARAGGGEAVVYADIDMSRSAEVRNSRSYTQLRRPELYK